MRRKAAMEEAEYWLRLERRLSGEFEGMLERHLRFMWCDGFIPEQYLLDAPAPRIAGRAFICNGPKEDEWELVLHLPCPAASKQEIDWVSLLPPPDVTRWLSVDPNGKCIHIKPALAVPDVEA